MQSVTAPRPRFDDRVLFLGMNRTSGHEVAELKKRGADVTQIADRYEAGEKIADRRGAVHDLSSNAGIDTFAKSLGLPEAQTAKIAAVLKGAAPSGLEELAQLAQIWAAGEKGGSVPSRVLLSGHSLGEGVFGDNGSVSLGSIADLAKAMPKAAGQVEDVMISACYSGTSRNVDALKAAFPNMKTFLGSTGSAPGTYSGAVAHEKLWEQLTRGRAEALDRKAFAGTRKGDRLITWSSRRGFDTGYAPASIESVKAAVDRAEVDFDRAFDGRLKVSDPQSGPLREYYNQVQRLLQHPDLDPIDRLGVERKRDQAIRLLYYSKSVAPRFSRERGEEIRAGYAAMGMTAPDYGKLSRADALSAIAEFEKRVTETPNAPAAAWRLLSTLQSGLRDLDRSSIPETWL